MDDFTTVDVHVDLQVNLNREGVAARVFVAI
jgi:hypothetical protein